MEMACVASVSVGFFRTFEAIFCFLAAQKVGRGPKMEGAGKEAQFLRSPQFSRGQNASNVWKAVRKHAG